MTEDRAPAAAPVDIAFSPAVRAAQARKGSAKAYADTQMADSITPDLARFIETRDSVYLGTAGADGQPYIQHRGGPPGFLKVLDPKTIGFADFRGNRQYISMGNLSENPKAFLFLMDYPTRSRVKVWGRARFVEDDAALIARLMPEDYRARPEQALLFEVTAWDANCPQHIPQKVEIEAAREMIRERDARIRTLEATIEALSGPQAGS